VRRLFEVFRGGMLAFERYQPQVCDCAVTLLRAADPLPELLRQAHEYAGSLYGDSTNGWDRYATGRLTVIETPGDHLTMIEKPNTIALAAHLGELLAGPDLTTSVGLDNR
jgi:thioesterase domain-containing protein